MPAAATDRAAAVLTDPHGDIESGILQLSEALRHVAALASDASELCSPLTLTQHASIIMSMLVGLYITIGMFVAGAGSTILRVSFVTFQLVTALRLAVVSVTGSRLTASGERLLETLVDAARPRCHLAAPLRFGLQMLVEQARKAPQFSGGGFFVTEKATMLSVLGFVLTYFIIMVQLNI